MSTSSSEIGDDFQDPQAPEPVEGETDIRDPGEALFTSQNPAEARAATRRKRYSLTAEDDLDHFEDLKEASHEAYQKWLPRRQERFWRLARELYKESYELMKVMHERLDEHDQRTIQTDRRITELLDTQNTLELKLDTVEIEVEQYKDTIKDKNAVIQHLETRSLPHRETTPFEGESVKVHRIDDPAKFSDEKGEIDYEEWRAEMRTKIELDHRHMPTEERKIAYVFSRTAGEARQKIFDKYVDKTFQTWDEVIKLLDRRFDSPHKREEHEREFANLTLYGTSFHKFLSSFETLVRSLKYDDDKKKTELVKRLTNQYLNPIVPKIHTSTFDQLIEELQLYDKTFELQKTGNFNRQRNKDKHTMETAQTSNTPVKRIYNTGTPRGGDQVPLRTQDERKALQEANLCYKCCMPGHQRPQCTEAKWLPVPNNLIVGPTKNRNSAVNQNQPGRQSEN